MQKYVFYDRSDNYGFDIDKINPVKEYDPYYPKPRGGLWASPVDSRCSWKNWSTQEHFMTCDDSRALFFTLCPDAKVFYCESQDDIEEMIRHGYLVRGKRGSYYCGTDAKRMERDGYDALYMDVHFAPYGWDVDTLFVINKDVIVPEEKREVLRFDEAFPNVVLTDNDGFGIKYDEWVVDCRTADEIVATIQFDRDEQFLSYTITIDKEKNLKLYEGDWYWDGCEIDISEIKSERILKDVQEMKNTLEEMKKKDKQMANISKTESNSKRVGSFSELFDRVEEMKASDVDDGKIHGGNKEDFLPG